jgi:hypothetical protein
MRVVRRALLVRAFLRPLLLAQVLDGGPPREEEGLGWLATRPATSCR